MYFHGQFFGLGDVVDLAARQIERERISQGVDDHVDFRSQAPARSAYRLINACPSFTPALFLMRSDDSSVDHGVFVVRIIRYGFERTSPNPLLRPPREPRVNVLRGGETHRHIAPGNAGGRRADYPIPIAPYMLGTTQAVVFLIRANLSPPNPCRLRQKSSEKVPRESWLLLILQIRSAKKSCSTHFCYEIPFNPFEDRP